MANGQSYIKPARTPSPIPDQQQESRPPSRARRDSLNKPTHQHKAEKRDAYSRGSGEIPAEQLKQSTPDRWVTPPSAPTPQPIPAGKPHSHATANHNSNAASSSHFTPRWVKPSENKLEAVRAAAAAREVHLSRGGSPAPSSSTDNMLPNRRPPSKGFVPGTNRGSNASQYDNVPGLEQEFEIMELERPPSRMRTPRSETPFSTSSLHQYSHRPSLAGSAISIASGPRMAKQPLHPPTSHNSPARNQTTYSNNQYHTPPKHYSPGRPTMVPILHPTYSINLEHKSEDRLYAPPSSLPPPSSFSYGDRPYAMTQQLPNSHSPERAFINSYATYHKHPLSSAQNPQNARPHPDHHRVLETQGGSTPIYLRQPTRLTSTTQAYAPADYRLEGPNPHNFPEGGSGQVLDGNTWTQEEEEELPLPPCSPGGVSRSPSFQRAQMSPVQEFVFPTNPDSLLHYRTQFQEQQPVVRQQLPQLFGGPHYRHAQEAFAMQESMLL
ncbi:hypothetical protein LDENG_00089630 [Lucifuga dentata]|nr:hypothetical protein LDENG_00089630 [Lucifuga dentata]